MSKFEVLFVIFIIFGISLINTELLNDCNTDIYPNGNTSDIIVCTNDCNECNIICDSKYQCQGITVFSGALITNIYCTNDYSCEGVSCYIGNNDDHILPNGYSSDSFTATYDSVNIDCTGNIACKGTKFYITGDYINGTNIDVHGNNDNFQDSVLECNLLENESCQLICGNSNNACKNATFECLGGKCACDGNGCSSLQTGNIVIKTNEPTAYLNNFPTHFPHTTVIPIHTILVMVAIILGCFCMMVVSVIIILYRKTLFCLDKVENKEIRNTSPTLSQVSPEMDALYKPGFPSTQTEYEITRKTDSTDTTFEIPPLLFSNTKSTKGFLSPKVIDGGKVTKGNSDNILLKYNESESTITIKTTKSVKSPNKFHIKHDTV